VSGGLSVFWAAEADDTAAFAGRVFEIYDTDHSGELSHEEMQSFVNSVLVIKTQLDGGGRNHDDASKMAFAMCNSLFAEADTDDSGAIDKSEFVNWFLKMQGKRAVESGGAAATKEGAEEPEATEMVDLEAIVEAVAETEEEISEEVAVATKETAAPVAEAEADEDV